MLSIYQSTKSFNKITEIFQPNSSTEYFNFWIWQHFIFVKQCTPADKEFWHQTDPWFVEHSSMNQYKLIHGNIIFCSQEEQANEFLFYIIEVYFQVSPDYFPTELYFGFIRKFIEKSGHGKK